MKGYINSFESFGTKDGPGIRFVLFLQGCPLRCLYCHNVDTWELRDKNYVYTPEEVLTELDKVRGFLTGGITVSGGEPLMQAPFVLELFKLCKEMYKTITSVDLDPTLEFINYLQEIGKPAWIRYVLLPGYSDDKKDLDDWAKFVSQFDIVKRVDILPFHQMAIYKWEKTNRDYKLKDTPTPTKEQIQQAEEIFRRYNLPLYVERK